jgi:hypothetical protein
VYLTSGTPPRVFVALEPPRNPAATNQAGVVAFYANDPDYRALITAACADYNYVTVVDLAPGWDNSTMVATGIDPYNFHPNAAGMTQLAGTFSTAIAAPPKAPGLPSGHLRTGERPSGSPPAR